AFMRWSDWLYARLRRQAGIALPHLVELLFEYLTREKRLPPTRVANALWHDYRRCGRSDTPAFLRDYITDADAPVPGHDRKHGPKRQARHLAQVGVGAGTTL